MSSMAVEARIPVEFYRDDELGTWHFHVDEPRVIGGGQATLEEARHAAAEAIAFALERDQEAAPEPGTRVEYVCLAVG
jgi:predicted RNase H-like HicB family nuclease